MAEHEIASYTNSEGERVAIEKVPGGRFEGQLLLVIYDDYPSPASAPMLLDAGTTDWLVEILSALQQGAQFGSNAQVEP